MKCYVVESVTKHGNVSPYVRTLKVFNDKDKAIAYVRKHPNVFFKSFQTYTNVKMYIVDIETWENHDLQNVKTMITIKTE